MDLNFELYALKGQAADAPRLKELLSAFNAGQVK